MKIKNVMFVSILIALIVLSAFGVYSLSLPPEENVPDIIISDDDFPQNSYSLNNINLAGNILVLDIQYGGGCEEHEFNLISGAVWAESYPVQVGVYLSHDNKGDTCEAYPQETLLFDLKPLKEAYIDSYGRTDVIIINFKDYNDESHLIEYDFSDDDVNYYGTCDTVGLRQDGKYCSGDGFWTDQRDSGDICENSFECDSNVCASGECVSDSLIQKIINFFKRIFG